MFKKLRPFVLMYLGFVATAYLSSFVVRHQVIHYENQRIGAWAKEMNARNAKPMFLEELNTETMNRIGFDEALTNDLEVASTPTLDDYRL